MNLFDRSAAAVFAAAALAACSGAIGPLPCAGDDQCGTGTFCGTDGKCHEKPVCAAPKADSCKGVCLDLKSDPANCGTCGNACVAPAGGSTSCAAGSCAPTCPSPAVLVAGACLSPPAAHTGVSAAAGAGQITLTWTPGAGATSTKVLRGVAAGQATAEIASVSSTGPFQDTGLPANAKFFYRLRAVNAAGTADSAEVSATTPLAAPTGLAAAWTSGGVQLTWLASGGASGYEVSRGASAGGPFAKIADVTALTYTDGAAPRGATVFYVVAAKGGAGTNPESAPASLLTPPPAIADLAAAATGSATIALTWSRPQGVSLYAVERKVGSGAYASLALDVPAGTAGTTDTYLDTAATTPGTLHTYRVTPRNAGGPAAASNEASATTPLAAPTGLQASWTGSGVKLTWLASGGASGYSVWRGPAAAGTFTKLADVAALTFTDGAPPVGATVFYVVSATNGAAQSPNSAPASILTPPPAVADLAAAASGSTIALTWTRPSGAALYDVERKDDVGTFAVVATGVLSAGTAESWSDPGLALAGTAYSYRVTARNATGSAAASAVASATTAPPQVTGASAAAQPGTVSGTTQKVQVTWAAAKGAASYEVSRKTGSGGTYAVIAASAGDPTANPFEDPAAPLGAVLFYQVRAKNGAGFGPPSAEATATTAPAAVASLAANAAAAGGNQAVALQWPGSTVAAGYKIFRREAGATFPTAALASVFHAGTPTAPQAWSDDVGFALPAGTTLEYAVVATNAAGDAPLSPVAATTLVPDAPADLRVVGGADASKVPLEWSAMRGATSYLVFRQPGSGAFPANVLAPAGSPVSFTDFAVATSTTYTYTVRSRNAAGSSADSNAISVTPGLLPPPANVWVQVDGPTQVFINFDEVPGAASYELTRAVFGVGTSTLPFAPTGPGPYAYRDNALQADTSYTYTVRAKSAGGTPGVASAPVTVITPLSTLFLQGSATSAQLVQLSWLPIPSAATYVVQKELVAGTGIYYTLAEIADTGGAAAQTFTDFALLGPSHRYQVTAYTAGHGNASLPGGLDWAHSGFGPTATAVPYGDARIELRVARLPGFDELDVIRSTSPLSPPYGAPTASLSWPSNADGLYVDDGNFPGSQVNYVARWRASADGATSDWSAVAGAKTATAPPNPVSSVVALAGTGRVALFWGPVFPPPTGYHVFRQPKLGTMDLLAILPGSQTAYVDLGPANGTDYTYAVTSFNSGFVSLDPATGTQATPHAYDFAVDARDDFYLDQGNGTWTAAQAPARGEDSPEVLFERGDGTFATYFGNADPSSGRGAAPISDGLHVNLSEAAYVRLGSEILVTTARAVDFGRQQVGRADQSDFRPLTRANGCRMSAPALLAWQEGDALDLIDAGAGYLVRGLQQRALAGLPALGDSFLQDLTFDCASRGEPLALPAAWDDHPIAIHLSVATSAKGARYARAVDYASGSQPGGLEGRTTALAFPAFTPSSASGTRFDFPLVVNWGAFDALRAGVNSSAWSLEAFTQVEVVPNGAVLREQDGVRLFVLGHAAVPTSTLDYGSVVFHDPAPPDWPPLAKVVAFHAVSYTLGTLRPLEARAGMGFYAPFDASFRSAAGAGLSPRIGPPAAATLNGLALPQTAIPVSGAVLAWGKPSLGTPTGYRVRVHRLTDNGAGGTGSEVAATFYLLPTPGSLGGSLRVPPGVLANGSTYYLEITAFDEPGRGGAFNSTPHKGLAATSAQASLLTPTFTTAP